MVSASHLLLNLPMESAARLHGFHRIKTGSAVINVSGTQDKLHQISYRYSYLLTFHSAVTPFHPILYLFLFMLFTIFSIYQFLKNLIFLEDFKGIETYSHFIITKKYQIEKTISKLSSTRYFFLPYEPVFSVCQNTCAII